MAIQTYGTVFHMKTTLVIDERIMARLKEEAAREEPRSPRWSRARSACSSLSAGSGPGCPSPSFDGGGSFVDVAGRDALYRAMEDR